jgi:hypothetical protein
MSDVEAVTVEEGIEGAEGDEGEGSVSSLPLPTKVANFTFEEVSRFALASPFLSPFPLCFSRMHPLFFYPPTHDQNPTNPHYANIS